nr:MAG TPA: hypothetical protein [Caudoviricetes sp.]
MQNNSPLTYKSPIVQSFYSVLTTFNLQTSVLTLNTVELFPVQLFNALRVSLPKIPSTSS